MSVRRINADKGGFTLVEILIALAIGSVVMAGAVGMFRSQRVAFDLLNQTKLLEENGRVGIDIMAREIRIAKPSGGLSGTGTVMSIDNQDASYAAAQASLGAKAGTDIMEIFASYLREPICIPTFNDNNANVQVPRSGLLGLPGYNYTLSNLAVGQLLDQYTVLIYQKQNRLVNCTQNITNGGWTGGNLTIINYNRGTNTDYANRPHDCNNLGMNPPGGVCIDIGTDLYYYVDANNQLTRAVVGGVREVVANYVEDFQVKYGADTGGDNLITSGDWVNSVADPTKLRMIKISLLMKSKNIDPNKGMALAPVLENSTVAFGAADQYRRRVFTRTVRLRNMEVN